MVVRHRITNWSARAIFFKVMDNPIDTMIINHLRAELDNLREVCMEWSRKYSELLQENEELREQLTEYQTI